LKPNHEQHRLARLQHANIVPIQNAFRKGPYHVVQMPFFGRQTLADVIDHVRTDTGFPHVGGEVFSTVAKATTQRVTKANSQKSDSGTLPKHETPIPGTLATFDDVALVEPHPLRDQLTGLPYPDAVLTLVRRLADGLAHAHNRGILHLDLKPHNVLFGDDGQPMLLDFNLSHDRSTPDRKRVGGTWPYMAPEVLREFAKLSDETADERTDLYALGVMFFELLTCRLPFSSIGKVPESLPAAIEERSRGIPSIRDINPDVPPAVESIVRKLVSANPADRYATADELREDLQRQIEHRPLRYAADRNLVERFQKWRKRNPNFVARAVGATALVGLAVGGAYTWKLSRQHSAAQFDREVAQFLADHEVNRGLLAVPTDAAARARGRESAERWMERFGAGQSTNWRYSPAILSLEPARQTELLGAIGELAILLAHADLMDSRGRADDAKANALDEAKRWNAVADECLEGATKAAVVLQRSIWSPVDVPAGDPTDKEPTAIAQYYQAVRAIGDGKLEQAIETLKELTDARPNHYAGQLMLGLSYQASGQTMRALERLQVARPLAPNDPRAGYHIGMLLSYHGKPVDAEKEFSAVLTKHPDHVQSLLQRGRVRKALRKYDAAIEDFTHALEKGGPAIPIHYYRAETYRLAGQEELAAKDEATANTLEPKTADDFSTRAQTVAKTDPAAALKLYNRAIELNPFFLSAWHNKAWLLSEKLDEWDLAVETIRKAIDIAPGFAPSRAGLAVLYARLGKRDDAHREIQKALALSGDSETLYQAACVYGLSAEKNPDDRAKALDYFRRCFREGFRRFDIVEADRDLKPLLESDDFQAVLDAARKLIK
jgi:tetratricopeptide (TPR) repeat protein